MCRRQTGAVFAATDCVTQDSWHERRIAILHSLLARWIAEHPAILAVDAERAREHQQAIGSLRQMIAALEDEALPEAVTPEAEAYRR